MLKTSPKPADAAADTSVDDSKVIGSSERNNKKLAKSGFTRPMHKAEESSFPISEIRRAFT